MIMTAITLLFLVGCTTIANNDDEIVTSNKAVSLKANTLNPTPTIESSDIVLNNNVEYTSNSLKTCEDNNKGLEVCTLTMWGGTKYVNELGEWKEVSKAKNLNNKGFICKINKSSVNDANVDCGHFNYTSITLDNITVPIAGKYPVKIYYYNETTDNKTLIFESELNFATVNEKKLQKLENLDNIFNYEFHIGFNSTTIILQDPNTENLDDTYVRSDSSATGGGSTTIYIINSTREFLGFIKYNISVLPANINVLNAEAYLNVFQISLGVGEGYNISAFSYDNYWNETDFIYSLINFSALGSVAYDTQFFGNTTPIGWYKWNVTDLVQGFTGNEDVTISFIAHDTLGSPSAIDYVRTRSKEYTTGSDRPYLNITYTEQQPTIYNETWNESSVPVDTQVSAFVNVTSFYDVDADIDTVIFEVQFPNGSRKNFTGVRYN